MDQKLIALLLNCLHLDQGRLDKCLLAALSAQEWEDLVALAADQRVRALLYHNLLTRGLEDMVPENILQTLKDFYTQNTLHNLRYSNELKKIVIACADENVSVLVLKGIYLAHVIYDQIGLREMNDIDLLVKKEDLARATEIMIASGYRPLEPFSIDWIVTSTFHHPPPFVKPNVAGVEIHWSIAQPEISPRFDIMDLWNQAAPAKIAQTEMLCLNPEDVLSYLCFHNAQHAFGFGLRPYCDIQATIDHFSHALDWDQILERVQRWGWERGVHLSLYLARDFVGAEVPEYILKALKPAQDTDAIYSIARSQTFASKASLQKINPNVASYTQLSTKQKVSMLMQRFFPSRSEIAHKYHVAPDSWVIWLKYPIRWKDLLFKHSKILLDVPGSDNELAELAKKKGELLHWLTGSQ